MRHNLSGRGEMEDPPAVFRESEDVCESKPNPDRRRVRTQLVEGRPKSVTCTSTVLVYHVLTYGCATRRHRGDEPQVSIAVGRREGEMEPVPERTHAPYAEIECTSSTSTTRSYELVHTVNDRELRIREFKN